MKTTKQHFLTMSTELCHECGSNIVHKRGKVLLCYKCWSKKFGKKTRKTHKVNNYKNC